MRYKHSTSTVALVALMGAFAALVGMISIPTPIGFPITIQVAAISLCGFLLGSKKGVAATLVYLALGALGLPVFAAFRGGVGEFFSATGGFLLSFPLLAAACGAVEKHRWLPWVGLAANYFVGALQLAFITQKAAVVWLLPCLAKDAVLLLAARRLAQRLRRHAPRA